MSIQHLEAKLERLQRWKHNTQRYLDDAPPGHPNRAMAEQTIADINRRIETCNAEIDELLKPKDTA